VPLGHLLNNLTTDQLYLIVITTALALFIFFFVKLVRGILKTLSKVDSTVDSVHELVHEIRPAIAGLNDLEEMLKKNLSETNEHVARLQQDASKLMDVLSDTAVSYQDLEKVLEARLEQEVPPILVETKELVTGAKEITEDIQEKIRATDNLFEAVNEAGQTVRMATGIVRGGLTGLAVQLASMAVGARKSLEYLTQNITTKNSNIKGGDSNE